MIPYSPRVQTDLVNSVEHKHAVWAYDANITPYAPVELELVTATINYDENRAPLVVLNGSMKIPDQALLDFLDPRRDVRIFVMAGYVYADGRTDFQKIVELRLLERVVRRPVGDMVIVAVSDEQRIMDYRFTTTQTWGPNDVATDVIYSLLSQIVGHNYPIQIEPSGRTFVAAGKTETLPPGGDVWAQIQSIGDRIGYRIYHNGLDTYVAERDRVNAGAATAQFRVGQRGTVIGSEAALDRTDFANLVVVTFTGGDLPVHGWAEVKAGPYGSTAIGRVALAVDVDAVGTSAQAEYAAAAMLGRAITRGRKMSLEVANATYWVRPMDTITVQLATGPQERHFVSSIEFDIPTGTMNVQTRQPENVVITTGE